MTDATEHRAAKGTTVEAAYQARRDLSIPEARRIFVAMMEAAARVEAQMARSSHPNEEER